MTCTYRAKAADGRVRFLRRVDPSFDVYTNAPLPSAQQWMRDKFWRMMVYSSYFDNKTSWYPTGLAYFDLYAIYKQSPLITQHPEWVLKDKNGQWLFIPWNCGSGTCPQYAADVSNPNFRRWWIDEAKRLLTKGYKGLWIDDVNLQFRVSDGGGNFVAPIDRNTGAAMTYDDWRRYVAEFVEQIRLELPTIEILHNSIWFAGPAGVRDADPYIRRQIAAADYINCEHGVNDSGLTGGTGEWSLNALLSFIERLHAMGKGGIIDDFVNSPTGREYALANYFLITSGNDGIGNQSMTPDNWWRGYDVDLGTPKAARHTWNGLMRRDFAGGLVLVNEPGAPTRTVTLPGSYTNIDGASVTTVTLAARQGVVLLGSQDTKAPVISGLAVTPSVSDAKISWRTDEPATSQVDFGPSTSYGQTTALQTTMATTHQTTLTGLLPSTTYYFRVRSSDAAGNAGTYTGSVKTTAAITPLTTTGLSPLPSEAAVPVSPTVSVKFSNNLVAATITTSNFVLQKSGVSIPATVAYYAATQQATLAPASPLAANTTYTAIVKSGAAGPKDVLGNMLASDTTWTFSTSASGVVKYVSDLIPTYSVNGWGPAENDMSNGEQGAKDGRTITLNGTSHNKGLGVHSNSESRYNLGGACSLFTSYIGIDDEVTSPAASAVFEVWADGIRLHRSAVIRHDTPAQLLNLNVAGAKELRLVVGDGGDGMGSDHADWASARLTCSSAPPSARPITAYLSDLTWKSAKGGYGPVERDRANGGSAANDGPVIKLNGVAYAKGLGIQANSDIRYNLGGSCSAFISDIGVDDSVTTYGTVNFQVWADGVKLVESGKMTGTSATRSLNVSLSGKKELALIVSDTGDGIGADRADWANARIICDQIPAESPYVDAKSWAYLSDLDPTSAKNGWGPIELDRSLGGQASGDGGVLKLNGVTYAKGLGVHAPSEIRYALNNQCTAFTAELGIDDEALGPEGSVVFQVWADGAKLYDSGVMKYNTATKPVNLNLTGKNELVLTVLDAGDGQSWDHANWANARIACRP